MVQKLNINDYNKRNPRKYKLLLYKSKKKIFPILLLFVYNKNKSIFSVQLNTTPTTNVGVSTTKVRFVKHNGLSTFSNEICVESFDNKIDVERILQISGGEQFTIEEEEQSNVQGISLSQQELNKQKELLESLTSKAKKKRSFSIGKICKTGLRIATNTLGTIFENPFLRTYFSATAPKSSNVKPTRNSNEVLGVHYVTAFQSNAMSPRSSSNFLVNSKNNEVCTMDENNIPSVEKLNDNGVPTVAIEQNKMFQQWNEPKPTKEAYFENLPVIRNFDEAQEFIARNYPDVTFENGETITGKAAAGHIYHAQDFGVDPQNFGMTQKVAEELSIGGLVEHVMHGTKSSPTSKHVKAYQNAIGKMRKEIQSTPNNHPGAGIKTDVKFFDINGERLAKVYYRNKDGEFFTIVFDNKDQTMISAHQRNDREFGRFESNNELGSRKYNVNGEQN